MLKFLSIFRTAPVLLLLCACSGSPTYFLLPPPQQTTGGRAAAPVSTISVAEISLPAYADAVEIAALSEGGVLLLDSGASWADTPRRGLTRHLVASLEKRLNARIAAEPWPGFERPGLRIEVITDRLVGALASGVEFSGQYIIVAPESGRIFAAERFAVSVPVEGEGYAALAIAHARAVERLADVIAARLSGNRQIGS